jgi:glutamate/aspartate transport system substrate-binding protein
VRLAIKWVPVDARNRFRAIIDGTADMECGWTTVSLSRMKLVDFSTVVFVDSTGDLIKSDVGINSFDGMAGRKIGVIAGSTMPAPSAASSSGASSPRPI